MRDLQLGIGIPVGMTERKWCAIGSIAQMKKKGARGQPWQTPVVSLMGLERWPLSNILVFVWVSRAIRLTDEGLRESYISEGC